MQKSLSSVFFFFFIFFSTLSFANFFEAYFDDLFFEVDLDKETLYIEPLQPNAPIQEKWTMAKKGMGISMALPDQQLKMNGQIYEIPKIRQIADEQIQYKQNNLELMKGKKISTVLEFESDLKNRFLLLKAYISEQKLDANEIPDIVNNFDNFNRIHILQMLLKSEALEDPFMILNYMLDPSLCFTERDLFSMYEQLVQTHTNIDISTLCRVLNAIRSSLRISVINCTKKLPSELSLKEVLQNLGRETLRKKMLAVFAEKCVLDLPEWLSLIKLIETFDGQIEAASYIPDSAKASLNEKDMESMLDGLHPDAKQRIQKILENSSLVMNGKKILPDAESVDTSEKDGDSSSEEDSD